MKTLHTSLAAIGLMAAMAADTGSGSGGGSNGNTNNAPAGGGTPAPAEKFYLATATTRGTPAEGKEPETVTFVVAGPDYKTAWQSARELTRVGDAHFTGKAWTDKDRKTAMKLIPGSFTVEKLDSLQPRSTKQQPITLDRLEAELEARGVKVPKDVQAAFDKLRNDPPAEPMAPAASAG